MNSRATSQTENETWDSKKIGMIVKIYFADMKRLEFYAEEGTKVFFALKIV